MISSELFAAWCLRVALKRGQRKCRLALSQSRARAIDVMCMRWSRDSVSIPFHSWRLSTQFRARMQHAFQLHVSQSCLVTFTRLKRVSFDRMVYLSHQAQYFRAVLLGRNLARSRNRMCGVFDLWQRFVRLCQRRRQKIATCDNSRRTEIMMLAFGIWATDFLSAVKGKQLENRRTKLQAQVATLKPKHQILQHRQSFRRCAAYHGLL